MFEINLVPDVKAEMIKAQKTRNVVFFVAATVSAIAIGLVVLLFSIKLGQDLKISGQDSQLKQMSSKIKEYDGLESLLTVQKQLSDLEKISDNKTLLSRVFTVLYSMVIANSDDEVRISSISADFATSDLSFDGQAIAGQSTDGFEFRVLDSFTKSVELMKYDYGRYVDKNGKQIPTICIFESDIDGVPFTDASTGGIYAIWAKGVEGCDPSANNSSDGKEEELIVNTVQIQNVDVSNGCNGRDLVCIRRTYKNSELNELYGNGEGDEKNHISLNGDISGIEHFESNCSRYIGTIDNNGTLKWTNTNNCVMAPQGFEITRNPSLVRDANGKLVLTFSAVLHMSPEVFSFKNKHMITVGPTGLQNVTDSFVQVGDMFAERVVEEQKE